MNPSGEKKEDGAGRRPSTSTSTKTDRADRVSIITLPDRFAQVTKSHRIIGNETPTDVVNPSLIRRRSLKPKTKKDSTAEDSASLANPNPSAGTKRRRESTKSKSSTKEQPPQKTPKTKPKTAENVGSVKKGNKENGKKKQAAEVPKPNENPPTSTIPIPTDQNSQSDAAPVLKYKRPTLLKAILKAPPEIVTESKESKEPKESQETGETKPPAVPLPTLNTPLKSTPAKKPTSAATAAKATGSKSAVVPKTDKSTSATGAGQLPKKSSLKEVKGQGQKIERSTSTSSQVGESENKEAEDADGHGAGGRGRKGSADAGEKPKHRYTAANKEQAELEVKVSGYVNLPDFADALVDIDPYEIHTWVKDMTTRLYLYAVFLLIVACLLNAAMIFIFHLIPQIFAHDILYRIFLINSLNYGSAVAVMSCILILGVWVCFCLTIPNPKTACVRKGRWFFCVLIELYILWCLISQFYECQHVKSSIEDAMIKDLTMAGAKKVRSPTRLEVLSQRYFDCCGIHSYEDWRSYGHLNRTTRPDLAGGYPVSCCNREYPECATPVTIYQRSDTEHDKIQLWTESCLEREYYMVVSVLAFVFILQFIGFLSSILVAVLLHSVINHTIIHSVGQDEVLHPFS